MTTNSLAAPASVPRAVAATGEPVRPRPNPPTIKRCDGTPGSVAYEVERGREEAWIAGMGETFGTASEPFINLAMIQLENMMRGDNAAASDERMNSALALMAAISPQDELQAVLGVQIVGFQRLAATMLAHLRSAETLPRMEALTRMATRANNSMNSSIEALSRLRSGGKQQVEVRYVYVNGNAVIGENVQAVFTGGDQRNGNRPLGPEGLARMAVEGCAQVHGED